MSEQTTLFRVDKFVVPIESKVEFLERVWATHEILCQQPGFIRDMILEQCAGPGRFNIVTIAEWQSQDAIDAARTVVQEAHARTGFSPQETMKRLGIESDIANYRRVDGR